jgi:lantibiotic modifying enzyme
MIAAASLLERRGSDTTDAIDQELRARWADAVAPGAAHLFALRQSILNASSESVDPQDWPTEFAHLERAAAEAADAAPAAEGARLAEAVALRARLRLHAHASVTRLTGEGLDAVLADIRAQAQTLLTPVVDHETALQQAVAHRPWAAESTVAPRPLRPRLLTRFPVAGRRLAVLAIRSAEAIAEVLSRFVEDAEALAAAFPQIAAGARITSISASLSDGHDGGRTVRVLTLEGGARLVYKPRSCALEALYFALLPRLASGIDDFHERFVTVLDRGQYGWMEFVEPRPCATEDEAHAFYRSAGRLAGIAYALAATDLHYENVIADGPCLVPVDLEMLFVPDTGIPELALSGGARQAYVRMKDSVLSTILLPTWQSVGPGTAMDLGGMSVRAAAAGPSHHMEAIIGGFTEVYRWFAHTRGELLAPDGPIAGAADLPVRFINRPTRLYARLLEDARRLACWRDGVERSLVFEPLFRALAVVPPIHQEPVARVIDAEVRALDADDVPCFRTKVGSGDLQLPNGEILRDLFSRSGLDAVRERLMQLCEDDLAVQVELIRAALALDAVNRETGPTLVRHRDSPPADAGALTTAAREIYERLARTAIRLNGSASWMAPRQLEGTTCYGVSPMPHGLYEGSGGVALFLAALHRTGAEPRAAALAREALADVTASLDRLSGTPADARVASNPASGLPGAVYVLSVAGELLDDPSLWSYAASLVPRIAAGVTRADTLDLLTGAAGTIVCLLSHAARTGDPHARRLAQQYGEYLLDRCERDADGVAMWPSAEGRLTGFSHGAAGFAAAFDALARATADPRFGVAARHALRFEHRYVLPEVGNWQDLRPSRRNHPPMATWCYGAPGIALARLGLTTRDEDDERDLAVALATTAAHPLEQIDQLCCGNMGRAVVLDLASQRLNRPDLRRRALEIAGAVIDRASRTGGYGCFATPTPGFEHPGYFQGVAGIGYALLQLAAPGVLPQVLAFE